MPAVEVEAGWYIRIIMEGVWIVNVSWDIGFSRLSGIGKNGGRVERVGGLRSICENKSGLGWVGIYEEDESGGQGFD
jgi:hypothetical protein